MIIVIHKKTSFHFKIALLSTTTVLWNPSNWVSYFDIFNLPLTFSQGCSLICRCTKKENTLPSTTWNFQQGKALSFSSQTRRDHQALVQVCNIPRLQSSKSLTQINTGAWVWRRELSLEMGSPGVSHFDITLREALRTGRNEQQTEKQKPVFCNVAWLAKPDLSPGTCQAD